MVRKRTSRKKTTPKKKPPGRKRKETSPATSYASSFSVDEQELLEVLSEETGRSTKGSFKGKGNDKGL